MKHTLHLKVQWRWFKKKKKVKIKFDEMNLKHLSMDNFDINSIIYINIFCIYKVFYLLIIYYYLFNYIPVWGIK